MPSILQIEDDDELRNVLKLILTRAGYEVREASNGKGIAEKYPQLHPDLVITDLLMPEKDGLEVIQELRDLDPTVKIIAMSGGGRASVEYYLPLAKKWGAQYTLSKPFSYEEFLATIQLALEAEK